MNFWGESVKEWTVHHEPGSFLVNSFTKAINGFTENSFVSGQNFEAVKAELCKYMESKLWVMVDAAHDFDSIGLTPRDYEYFYLQMEFWSYVSDDDGNNQWAGH